MFRTIGTITAVVAALAFYPSLSADETDARSVVVRSKWVRFDVISGRITASRARFGKEKTVSIDDAATGVRESFSVRHTGTAPSVTYERNEPKEQISIEIVQGSQVSIHAMSLGPTDDALEFRQPQKGNLSLTITRKNEPFQYKAETFWHLMLAEPNVCQTHLVPILQLLRNDWRLAETATEIQRELVRQTAQPQVSNGEVQRLVRRLDSPKFLVRQSAGRKLRQLGPEAFAHLTRMNQRSMSTEQRSRIREVLRSLKVEASDVPERFAAQMNGDPSIYLVLLADKDFPTRKAAKAHLENLTGTQIEFDPAIEGEALREEVAQLRRRLRLN